MNNTQSLDRKDTAFMPFPLALMVWSSIALFFLLVSWAAGGDKFKDSIYGDYGLVAMLIGLLTGGILMVASRSKK